MYGDEDVLECQDCGRPLIELSKAEAQAVANNPYNYVIRCAPGAGCRIGDWRRHVE